MMEIDKTLYESLKKWCYGERPKNQFIMYVNSKDRKLTDATIRKLMYDLDKRDSYGDAYECLYSVEHFYRNMRNYYAHIAKLYRRHPIEDDTIDDIIGSFSSLGGWLTLIIEDMELMADKPEQLQEMYASLIRFAAKRSNVILVGNGDYQKVFGGCESVVSSFTYHANAKEEDGIVMIGLLEQQDSPVRERLAFENSICRYELEFYWKLMYRQLDKGYYDYEGYSTPCKEANGYFDFENFKTLYKDTFDYLIPRVSKHKVFRNDIMLIELTGRFKLPKDGQADGCEMWELDAAGQFSGALHEVISDSNGRGDRIHNGTISFCAELDDPPEEYDGCIYIEGAFFHTMVICSDNVCKEMDILAEAIHQCKYKGDFDSAMEILYADEKG